jgi:NuA3 HAT complex component NTO1
VRRRLEERFYTSVSTFSADLANVFASEIGVQPAEDTAELQLQISGRAPELSLEQREKRKLAKRIIKSIQPALEDAIRRESELNGKPFEKELKELDLILESSMLSRRVSLTDGSTEQDSSHHDNFVDVDTPVTKAEPNDEARDVDMDEQAPDVDMVDFNSKDDRVNQDNAAKGNARNPSHLPPPAVNGIAEKGHESVSLYLPVQFASLERGQLTPPLSFQGDPQLPLAQGGIQWYMQPFDPSGTIIHEERWTGRDVMRSMSEELSELDEDELKDLVDIELEGIQSAGAGEGRGSIDGASGETPKGSVRRTRRRWKGFR